MADVRALLLETARSAFDLAAGPAVTKAWDEPSALDRLTVSALAGHLIAGGTRVVTRYLDADEPVGSEPIDAATYFATILTLNLDDELHQGIRARSAAAAAEGRQALVDGGRRTLDELAVRLPAEPADRLVQVRGGLVLRLDEYLVSRLVELVVHSDDLAASVGVPTPEPPPEALILVLDCLVGVARVRHGEAAVVRALARRERDAPDALRVL